MTVFAVAHKRSRPQRQPAAGFTLVEVMVALVIMAIVAALAGQAFHTASTGAAATREAMERMAQVDRTFVLIESDLRNALPKVVQETFGQPLPPIYIGDSTDYWMTVLRGGMANPLNQPRTEMVRIGYRYVGETLWRDTWFNPAQNEQEQARTQKLLTGVNNLNVRVLPPPPQGKSIAAGPWLQDWPSTMSGGGAVQGGQQARMEQLPIAVEITVELTDMGEITRLFSLLPGQGAQGAQGTGT